MGLNFSESGIPFLRIQNLYDCRLSLDDVLYIDSMAHQALKRSVIRGGDFLITIAGTIGRSAIVPADFPESNCNQAIAILRIDEARLLPKYLQYWMSTPDAMSQISGKKVTATISNLSLGKIKELEVPLPPLKEQQRIVAILDKADAIRRKRQQAIALADEFLRAVFLDMFGDPVTNPKGILCRPLREVVKVVSGATPSKGRSDYWEGKFPWVSPKDMKTVEICDSIDHVSELVFSETNIKKLPVDTVLIVVRGMILAHTVPISITKAEVAINQDVKGFVCGEELLPEFLLWFLKSQHENLLSKVSTAAHGTKRFDMSDVLDLPVFIPDRAQQKKFVEVVVGYGVLENNLSSQRLEVSKLFSSLGQKAFTDQL
ncbi:restriction endonuclease subunit S [Microbulbifer agarilyticus]